MRWHETQNLIARALLDHPEAIAPSDPVLAGLFTGNAAVLPERLKIYRNNVMGNLTAALRATYPLVEKLTGAEFTLGLFRAFILKHPPREARLDRYGAELGGFIEDFVAAQGVPALADLARLEWAMNESYYAPDDNPFHPDSLRNVAHEQLADLVLPLRLSVRLLASRWPLLAIRDFCLKENRGEQETLNLDQSGDSIMVYRPGLSTEVLALGPAEYAFLQMLKSGNPLGNALTTTLSAFPDFDFQGLLQKHLGLETIATLTQGLKAGHQTLQQPATGQ